MLRRAPALTVQLDFQIGALVPSGTLSRRASDMVTSAHAEVRDDRAYSAGNLPLWTTLVERVTSHWSRVQEWALERPLRPLLHREGPPGQAGHGCGAPWRPQTSRERTRFEDKSMDPGLVLARTRRRRRHVGLSGGRQSPRRRRRERRPRRPFRGMRSASWAAALGLSSHSGNTYIGPTRRPSSGPMALKFFVQNLLL